MKLLYGFCLKYINSMIKKINMNNIGPVNRICCPNDLLKELGLVLANIAIKIAKIKNIVTKKEKELK
jgi:hypothetical protein